MKKYEEYYSLGTLYIKVSNVSDYRENGKSILMLTIFEKDHSTQYFKDYRGKGRSESKETGREKKLNFNFNEYKS